MFTVNNSEKIFKICEILEWKIILNNINQNLFRKINKCGHWDIKELLRILTNFFLKYHKLYHNLGKMEYYITKDTDKKK